MIKMVGESTSASLGIAFVVVVSLALLGAAIRLGFSVGRGLTSRGTIPCKHALRRKHFTFINITFSILFIAVALVWVIGDGEDWYIMGGLAVIYIGAQVGVMRRGRR